MRNNFMHLREHNIAIIATVCVIGLGIAAAVVPTLRAAQSEAVAEAAEEKRWVAVAPGRVEPLSGQIKITAPAPAMIGEVLVKANDKVFAGEALVHLTDDEVSARFATAEAQVALRRRARDDESASFTAGTRRKAEDAVAEAEKAVRDAQATVDRIATERRAGRRSDAELETARTALSQAQDRVQQQKAELRRIVADPKTPLPNNAEGQLNIARSELQGAAAALQKLTIRAPRAGEVLQVNAKAGELASPSAPQPLLILGDVSALRVHAELDERDLGNVKVGQPVIVRADAFGNREFAGKVSFIAPLVERGRLSARGQNSQTDIDVIEVQVDLTDPGPLTVGMKVDVYFRPDRGQS
jgi:HlyD family secretion protein